MYAPALTVSIVIPIYNEAAMLGAAISELCAELETLGWRYQVILAENGSTDATREIAHELLQRYPKLVLVSVPEPNYGLALRTGIESASGEIVVADELDLLDTEFYVRALPLLEQGADLVVGSKLAEGARDERPLFRHAASLAYNQLLRWLVGFVGTDTHGLKAMRRAAVLPIARACLVDGDVFASELVIRAYRASLRVVEIPTRVRERRPPSINLMRRVPGVLRHLVKLTWSIRRSP